MLKRRKKNPSFAPNSAYLAMAYALKGEDAKARAAAAELRRLDPNETLSEWRKRAWSRPAAYKEWFEKQACSSVAQGTVAGMMRTRNDLVRKRVTPDARIAELERDLDAAVACSVNA